MRVFFLSFLAVFSPAFTSCRSYVPVERHFLRVPAAYAAGLSAIDREKWVKRAHQWPGVVDQAKHAGYLELPEAALPPDVAAPGSVAVKFFPSGQDSRQGAVALLWPTPDASLPHQTLGRLWLLKTDGGRYLHQPLQPLLPAAAPDQRFSLTAVPGAIVAYQRVGSGPAAAWCPSAVLHWKQGRWVVEQRGG